MGVVERAAACPIGKCGSGGTLCHDTVSLQDAEGLLMPSRSDQRTVRTSRRQDRNEHVGTDGVDARRCGGVDSQVA